MLIKQYILTKNLESKFLEQLTIKILFSIEISL